jgi:hypothetical protein
VYGKELGKCGHPAQSASVRQVSDGVRQNLEGLLLQYMVGDSEQTLPGQSASVRQPERKQEFPRRFTVAPADVPQEHISPAGQSVSLRH